MSKTPYPCKGGPEGVCRSLCCFQAADALHSILDLKLAGVPVDPKILDFPYTVDSESGRCEKLSPDGTFCTVYLDRPLLCNIDKAAVALGLDPMLFLAGNAEACNNHMTDAGVPKEQQIDLEKYRVSLAEEYLKSKEDGTFRDSKRGANGDTGNPTT